MKAIFAVMNTIYAVVRIRPTVHEHFVVVERLIRYLNEFQPFNFQKRVTSPDKIHKLSSKQAMKINTQTYHI